MTILRDEDFYRTSDFYLAVTVAVWIPLMAVDRTDPRRTVFIFSRAQELDDVVAGYHAKTLRIEPQAFSSSIRALKARLYEA